MLKVMTDWSEVTSLDQKTTMVSKNGIAKKQDKRGSKNVMKDSQRNLMFPYGIMGRYPRTKHLSSETSERGMLGRTIRGRRSMDRTALVTCVPASDNSGDPTGLVTYSPQSR